MSGAHLGREGPASGARLRREGASVLRLAVTIIAAGVLVSAQAKPASPTPSGGNGKLYIGTYAGDIQIIDEATEKLLDRIVLKTGMPRNAIPSQDRTRFYVLDSTFEQLEVVDIASKSSLSSYSLREGNKRTRVISMQADPLNRFLILLTRTATKLVDRWEIGPPTLQQFDLATGKVTRTIPWPRNEERENMNLRFSPDGKFVYFFSEDVIVLDTTDFKEVDTWPYSQPAEPGLGRVNFGPVHDFYDPPGIFTGLFTMQDPVQNRRIMGIGRVDLTARQIDFRPVGPAEQVSFVQAPDRKRAYGLKQEIGRYEFWTFDLAKAAVVSRDEFKGRPRMGLRVSSNGQLLYVFQAGATIDVYDAATYKYLRTIQMNADQTTDLYVVPAAGPTTAR
jgi:DNA-binding beta-propeller fold protein YncE